MSDRRKKILRIFMFVVLLPGVVAVIHIFTSALKPPANAGEDLIRFDPKKLKVDELVVIDRGDKSDFKYKFIVLKAENGIRVFGIEGRDDVVIMPFFTDRDTTGSCERLAAHDKIILCIGQRYDASKDELWQWDYNGKNISGKAPDLRQIRYKYEGGVIAIGKDLSTYQEEDAVMLLIIALPYSTLHLFHS